MNTITRSALVDYDALKMYALVANIETYAGFLPWCRSSRVLERTQGPTAGRTVATLIVGMKGVSQSFTTENLNRPGEAIDIRLVEGPFKEFHGAWSFQPLGEHAAKIEFSLAYEIARGVLGKALEPLFDHIADTMVDAFVRRARSVYGPAES